ncbi:MAG: aminodeoxychorismate/anthranilate synthase component II [Methanoregulaceae archaeon]|jgi:anthranilate synthase/aminodeoxychorismate synthase-like glutamine amidotransferase|nr:aminodeoxychorismate/anthranilate synthase component II [Methanoregulaceae archaeon]
MRVAIIDCYDSFTYNLYQLVGQLGSEPIPVPCDAPLREVREKEPERIILSPGPGTPDESGICRDVIREYAGSVPILGVCLGHQTIVQTFGGRICRMQIPVHGKTSSIIHTGEGVFSGIPSPFSATRYHSLMADPGSIPPGFEIQAVSSDDRCIMAVAHPDLGITGVQFHPESIMTAPGRFLMKNFLEQPIGGE